MGSLVSNYVPDPVRAASGEMMTGLVGLSVSGDQSCAATNDGGVVCWGDNARGQLGTGEVGGAAPTPAPVVGETSAVLAGATGVVLGAGHGCAYMGAALGARCWGDNAEGQLGHGVGLGSAEGLARAVVDATGAPLGDVRHVALGFAHSCALLGADGNVVCWGSNLSRELGREGDGGPLPELTNDALSGVAQLALGTRFSCARTTAGRVLCWGANANHELGGGYDDNVPFRSTPLPVVGEGGPLEGVLEIAVGGEHGCAVVADGRVVCWGSNRLGQFGTIRSLGTISPTALPASDANMAPLRGMRHVVAGGNHTCARAEGGEVLCWGWNHDGQLGNPANLTSDDPNPVPAVVAGLPVSPAP